MEQSELIDEIVSRVTAKLAWQDGCARKPGLLILTQQHGEACHAMLESERLRERFRTDCALLRDYQVDLAEFDVVVLFHLTNEALGRLTAGICDTPYTKLALQAILLGKRIFVPSEEVELYRYASTAPATYYAMMLSKLNLLTNSGVTIRGQRDLEHVILEGGELHLECRESAEVPAAPAKDIKELSLLKRVITEKDVHGAQENHITCIRLPAKCIITALAQEYARESGINLIRE